MAKIKGEVLEILVKYLHYKFKYINAQDYAKIPQFEIKPDLGLDVLQASIKLDL